MDEIKEIKEIKEQTLQVTKAISTIKSDVMNAVDSNKEVLTKVIETGEGLLSQATSGMNDDLDCQISEFLKSTRNEVKNMNEVRKPVTQIFDLVKKGFTKMEEMLSPKNEDSVIFKLQVIRDDYARYKIEEERKREEERQRLARIQAAKDALASDIISTCNDILREQLEHNSKELYDAFSLMTLDNKDMVKQKISNYPTSLELAKFLSNRKPSYSNEINPDDARNIMNTSYSQVNQSLCKQYSESISQAKEDLLLRFDSKVFELEENKRIAEEAEKKRIEAEEKARKAREAAKKADEEAKAKADAEAAEAERIAELERKNQEAKRKEAEEKQRQIREADEAAAKEQQNKLAQDAEVRMQAQKIAESNNEANDLFNQAGYVSNPIKAKITEHIEILEKSAWIDIIQTWWAKKGIEMDDETLEKKLGFMKKAVEDLNNKEDYKILSEKIKYIEDIKAK